MTTFNFHNIESAPQEAKPILEDAYAKTGTVPNLYAGMAEAPSLLKAYVKMTEWVMETSFTPAERHVVWFTVNAEHHCDYCMAAHTAVANRERIPSDVIEAARDVAPQSDVKLETLRLFTLEMVRHRGWVSEEDMQRFIKAGFTRQNVLEVVLIVSHKVLSNYANHVLDTPLDDGFKKYDWPIKRDEAAE